MRLALRFVVVLGIGLLTASCNPPTAAEFFVVNTVADTIDASVGDGVCADAGGNCSLRAAVMEANANPNLTEIQLTGGETYTLSIAGRGEDASLTGDLDLLAHTYIRANVGSGQATIDAGGLDRAIHTIAGALHFLEGLILTGGAATDENGGALLVESALVGVEDTRITGNSAGNGGGVFVSGGTLAMEDSTVDSNTASNYGGGLDIRSNATLYQSTFTGNTSGVLNSQISVDITGTGQLHLLASTVDGDVFALDLYQGNVVILDSIIAAQTQACYVERQFGTTTSLGFNVASDATCGLTAAGDQQNIDPVLLPLSDNGGPVPTMLLGADSPALDTHPCPVTTTPDARQQPRPSGAACDTGAIEAQPDEVLGADCTTPPNIVPGAQLKNCDLSGLGVFPSTIDQLDLERADLTGANLTYAYLEVANLSNANLTNANLTGTQLGVANLSNANLTNANLTDAELGYANLTGADLTGANLTGTISGNIVGSPKLPVQWQMSNGYFIGPGAHLVNADLKRARLSYAFLTGANLTGADLTDADLSYAYLENSTLTDAHLSYAYLFQANLTGADLTGANLNHADLETAAISQTIFRNANLESASFKSVDIAYVDLTGANLTKADLSDAMFVVAIITTTNFTGANFTNVEWVSTVCPDGSNSDDNRSTCLGHL